MKKKFLSILTLCIMVLICAIGLVACNGDNTGNVDNRDKQIVSIYNTYVAYAEENGQTPLSYEEWLNSIKGKDGINGLNGKDGLGVKSVVVNNDGHLIITYTDNNSVDAGLVKGKDGLNGQNGQDGITPTISISEDGYWIINNEKTTVKAEGTDGENGQAGKDGQDGANGLTPYIKDGYWWLGENNTNVKAEGTDGENGQDGVTPTISISEDGYWVINNEKTSVKAVGVDGKNGQAGKDGNDGVDGLTPYIKDGYWWIGENNTNVKAQGTDGENGQDGVTPTISISADGYWVINNEKTSVKAVGADGQNGKDGSNAKEVKSAEIDKDGNLIITYKDDTTENLGKIKDNSKCEHEYSDYIITEIGDIGYRKEYYCKKCHEVKSELYVYTEGIEYALSEDGESAYVKSIGTATDKEIILRNTYQGKPVKEIGFVAFMDNDHIESIIISDSIEIINHGAFKNCTNLKSLTIPKSVKKFYFNIFIGCSNLSTVNYLGSVDDWCEIWIPQYDSSIFYGNKDCKLYCNGVLANIIEINYSNKIGRYTFYNSNLIESITILDGVETIEQGAFESCHNLKHITFGNSVKKIEIGAFRDCKIENVNYLGTIDNWLKIDGLYHLLCVDAYSDITTVYFNEEQIESITINSVEKINEATFTNFKNLKEVIIGDSVTSIGAYAFTNCTSLTNITIGKNMKKIGDGAFHGCKVSKVNYLGTIDDWCEIDFGRYASNPISKETELYINGELVTRATIKKMNSRIFYNYTFLTDVIIDDDITTISEYAFNGCSSLTSIIIPNSVTSIGSVAFGGCSSLTSVNYLGTIDSWCEFSGAGSLMACNDKEKLLYINNNLITKVEITTATQIVGGAFYYNSNITSVIIGDSVKTIGTFAFCKCNSLTSIIISNSVTIIEQNVFDGCTSLTSVIIGNGVTEIGPCSFRNCSSLTDVSIGDSIKGIADGAFDGCDLLKYNEYNGIKYLGNESNPFVVLIKAEDKTLTSFTSLSGTRVIMSYAFDWCSNLENVIIGDSVIQIGYYAFARCRSLKSIILGNSIEDISGRAFWNCGNLTNVTIGNAITYISDSAFEGCNKLQYYEYENGLYLGNSENPYLVLVKAKSKDITNCVVNINCNVVMPYAFEYCSLQNITIGNRTTFNYAFRNCSLAKVYYIGTATEWSNLDISWADDALNNATKYYYSESEPQEEGNYWHYDADGITIVEW